MYTSKYVYICTHVHKNIHIYIHVYIYLPSLHCDRIHIYVYGVATISRLLQIIGLFCKRAL